MVNDVKLEINGENVPLNQYVSKVFKKVNLAIIETLKGIEGEIESITLRIENLQ